MKAAAGIVRHCLFLLMLASSSRASCRLSGGLRLERSQFRAKSCADCFYYTYLASPVYMPHYCVDRRLVVGLRVCRLEEAEFGPLGDCFCRPDRPLFNLEAFVQNKSHVRRLDELVVEPPLPPHFAQVTRHCCVAAERCCADVLEKDDGHAATSCPATWDGWQCFERTRANVSVRGRCPSYILRVDSADDFTQIGYSLKHCTSDGGWFTVDNASEHTFYEKCVHPLYDVESAKWTLSIASNIVSVVATVIAVVIISSYRLLYVQDCFKLHRQFLLSLFATATFVIFNFLFFYLAFDPVAGLRFVRENTIICRILTTIHLRYLRLCNYTWMLCEGFYITRLLLFAFDEPANVRYFYAFGWGFPALPTLLYVVLRAVLEADGESGSPCWINATAIRWIEWVCITPCLVSIAVNSVLMLCVLLVIGRKVFQDRALAGIHQSSSPQYRCLKMLRATLMLLPVFGGHFLVTIYPLKFFTYEILDTLLDGLQGFLVSVILCYSNGRVFSLLRKSWTSRREMRELRRESGAATKNFRLAKSKSLIEHNDGNKKKKSNAVARAVKSTSVNDGAPSPSIRFARLRSDNDQDDVTVL